MRQNHFERFEIKHQFDSIKILKAFHRKLPCIFKCKKEEAQLKFLTFHLHLLIKRFHFLLCFTLFCQQHHCVKYIIDIDLYYQFTKLGESSSCNVTKILPALPSKYRQILDLVMLLVLFVVKRSFSFLNEYSRSTSIVDDDVPYLHELG